MTNTKQASSRYIANWSERKKNREFHSLRRHKPDCNVNDIKVAVYSQTGRDLREAGFDPCAKCCRHWKSHENT